MQNQILFTTGEGQRLCRHYTMIGTYVIVIALVAVSFGVAMLLLPEHWQDLKPAFHLFAAFVCGMASAYNLPIWKRRGM